MDLPNCKRTAPAHNSGPLHRKLTVLVDSPGAPAPPNHKRTAPVNSPSPFGLPNCKQAAPSDSPGSSSSPNRNETALFDSPGTTRTGTAHAGKTLIPVRKQRHFNASLVPN